MSHWRANCGSSGTELRSSGLAASTFPCWATSPVTRPRGKLGEWEAPILPLLLPPHETLLTLPAALKSSSVSSCPSAVRSRCLLPPKSLLTSCSFILATVPAHRTLGQHLLIVLKVLFHFFLVPLVVGEKFTAIKSLFARQERVLFVLSSFFFYFFSI